MDYHNKKEAFLGIDLDYSQMGADAVDAVASVPKAGINMLARITPDSILRGGRHLLSSFYRMGDPDETIGWLVGDHKTDGTLRQIATGASPFLSAAAGAVGTYRAKKRMREAGVPEHIIEAQGPSYGGSALRGALRGSTAFVPYALRKTVAPSLLEDTLDTYADTGELPSGSLPYRTMYNLAGPTIGAVAAYRSASQEAGKADDLIKRYGRSSSRQP